MKTFYLGFFLLITSIVLAQNSPAYPVLTGVVMNGCDNGGATPSCATLNSGLAGNCVEGRTEIAFFRAGTTAISAATIQAMSPQVIQLYTSPWANCAYWSGSSINYAAETTVLNSTGCGGGSCGTCFKDAWTTGIPAGATFMMVCGYFCVGSNDFTSLCGNGTTSPIYVIYFGVYTPSGTCGTSSSLCGAGTDGGWGASGNYTNYSGTAATKGISIDMSSLVAGAPTLYYDYDVSLEANGNGAGAYWGNGGTTTGTSASPTAYTSATCLLPVVLPIDLLDFTATKTNEDNITLKWTTATEINDDYFMVEYSLDGGNFTTYKEVKGAGNSNDVRNYNCLFTNEIANEAPYFRLKQVDKNGAFKYSNIITLPGTAPQVKTYYNTDNSSIINKFSLKAPAQINFSLFNITGQEVYTSTNQFNEGANEFSIPAPEVGGVYIVVYQNESSAPVHKKVLITK